MYAPMIKDVRQVPNLFRCEFFCNSQREVIILGAFKAGTKAACFFKIAVSYMERWPGKKVAVEFRFENRGSADVIAVNMVFVSINEPQ